MSNQWHYTDSLSYYRSNNATRTYPTNMIQFSESYNAKTIFDQVWESPYEWFGLSPTKYELPILGKVYEMTGPNSWKATGVEVTVEMIEEATIKFYMEFVANREGTQYPPRYMSAYLEDMDADDVDAILQLAVFKEIRYG